MSSSFCFVLNTVPNKSIYNVTSKYCTKVKFFLYNKYRSQNNSAVIPVGLLISIYQSNLPEHMVAPFTCRPNLSPTSVHVFQPLRPLIFCFIPTLPNSLDVASTPPAKQTPSLPCTHFLLRQHSNHMIARLQ